MVRMAKAPRRRRRANGTNLASRKPSPRARQKDVASGDAIKAAEEVAMAAFSSGLRLAAAFGTVAAKTTSLALASLATGADKFSELVRKEALAPTKRGFPSKGSTKWAPNRTSSRHAKRRR